MPNLNSCHLIGNLTRSVEIKFTPRGTAIAQFGIAINRSWTNDAGDKQEETTFVDIEAFARLAEVISEYCKKGDPIFIDGRLKLETWDDKQSGQKRSKLKVIAESIQFLGGKREGSQQQEPQPQRPPASKPAGRQMPPRPAADPDLDASPDDIPF